jgi:hypothetical protein
VEKFRYLGDVGLAHAPFDLDVMHRWVTLSGPVAGSIRYSFGCVPPA